MKLEKQKVFEISGDTFILDITKIKVGDFLAIEVEKQRLSGNKYFELATTFFANSLNAANLIEMIATFRVLLPEIEKSLVEPFEKLNLIDAKDLLRVYLKEVSPWYQDWMKEFNAPFEEDVKDEE